MARGMWWDGEELKAELTSSGEHTYVWTRLFALILGMATLLSLVGLAAASALFPFALLLLILFLPVCLLLGIQLPGQLRTHTGVVVSDRTVRVRQSPLYRRHDLAIGDLVAVAAMRNPERALRLETADTEWILPAGNLTERELDELVEAIRGLQTVHRDIEEVDDEAERRHAAAIRKLTSRSETR